MIELNALRQHWKKRHADDANRIFVALSSCGSTNRVARDWALRLLEEQTTLPRASLIAEEQTAGRGRLDRGWNSPRGRGLYLTLIEPFPLPRPEWLGFLPIAAGVAACQALRTLMPGVQNVGLKWPNDLYVGKDKLGGILIELAERAGASWAAAIVGIGVNWKHDGDDFLGPAATSFSKLIGAKELPALEAIAGALGGAISAEIARCVHDTSATLAAYRSLSIHRAGDRIGWQGPGGRTEGVFEGFSERGSILLTQDGELREVMAGDIFLTDEKPSNEGTDD